MTPSTINYVDMVTNGWTSGNASVQQTFDECTSTPFIYYEEGKLLVPYDDDKSIAAKCSFGKSVGTGGAALFTAQGDSVNMLVQAMIDNC